VPHVLKWIDASAGITDSHEGVLSMATSGTGAPMKLTDEETDVERFAVAARHADCWAGDVTSPWIAASGTAALVCTMGCASSASREEPADAGPVDGTAADGAVADVDHAAADVPSFGTDGGSRPADHGCSGDLQNVVDADGGVIQACAPSQGCYAGACTAPCAAAADAKGSVGCDFLVPTPDFQNELLPPCFAVFLANNWPRSLTIQVTRGGVAYDVTRFGRLPRAGQPETSWPNVPASGLPAGEVAVLFLSSDPNAVNGGTPMTCPVPDATGAATAIVGTGRGQAFHITTDAPVSAYDIHPYGGARSVLPSAELLLPTSAWGTNYVAAVPKPGDYVNLSVADGPQWAQIVGSVDGTTVTISPTVALPGGTNVAPAPAKVVTTFTIGNGEIIQWQPAWSPTAGSTMEMSGSVLASDHPIAFVGGNGYLCLKSATNADVFGTGAYGGCDSGHQMIPPVSALPFEYAVAPYATRRPDHQDESIPYRIVGAVAGTSLAYDPPAPGAPAALGVGQVVDFEATGPFVVRSQDASHPFYIGQMMTGCNVIGSGGSGGSSSGTVITSLLGDEEFVNVPAPAQYLDKYVFFTDPTYSTTNLVITRKATPAGAFADVRVDCLGTVTGWKPIGSGGSYETTNVDLVRLNLPTGSCQNGPHVAESPGPFAVVVWGLDTAASYAYPAGGNIATLSGVVVPTTPQ
jgi:hypothetical protein